jgi:hypothetical protein
METRIAIGSTAQALWNPDLEFTFGELERRDDPRQLDAGDLAFRGRRRGAASTCPPNPAYYAG